MHEGLSDFEGRVKRVLEKRLWPAVWTEAVPLAVTAAHLPGEPEPFAAATARAFTPFAVPGAWGPAWSTTWFRFTGSVPAGWLDREAEAVIDLGFLSGGPGFECEGLVYTPSGHIVKGVEPRTTWVGLADVADSDGKVDFYVEAAANPRLPGETPTLLGDRLTAGPEPLYTLVRADVALVAAEVRELALDLAVLSELEAELPAATPRKAQLRAGISAALDVLDPADLPGSAGAARNVLKPLLAAPAAHSAHRISAVGHAHIDSAWLWPVRETIRKCARTFSNVHYLAKSRPDLRFALSQAQQYAWMKEHYPEVYGYLKDLVARGVVRPAGGMWVEADTNMTGGEAMARQFTQGKRFFLDEFGVEPREVWLPDCFGYSGALPQIARLAGMTRLLTQKMSWNQTNRFPHHTFWWEGIDGSRLFTHFPPADDYNTKFSGRQVAHNVRNFADLGPANRSLMAFGYGDGGGGPTREMMWTADRLADLEGSARIAIETPDEFFAAAEAEYGAAAPTWTGEMYLEFHRGTLTSQRAIKAGNRRTEHLLREAELWAATAAVRAGFDYPYAELDSIWQALLLHQFHDILPGSSIAWVNREAAAAYADLAARLEAVITSALAALAGSGTAPLLFNADPFERDGVVALGAGIAAGSVPLGQPGGPDGPDAARRPLAPGPQPVTVDAGPDGAFTLDNGLVRVVVDAAGAVASVVDLAAGRELVTPGERANRLILYRDEPVKFDAWDLDEYYRRSLLPPPATEAVEGLADGVRVVQTFGASRFAQTIRLAPGARRVDFTLDADWHEREKVLKIAFPLDIAATDSQAETQFGHHTRAAHTNTSWDAARFEICAHRWLRVAEPGYGAALVNDSVYGHDVTRAAALPGRPAPTVVARLTALRAPRYPDPETDQGRQAFRYALVAGASVGDAVREGYRINLPRREGTGPAAGIGPLAAVEGAVVSAVKLADDRSGDVVVRVYEAAGARTRAALTPGFPATAKVTDLLERDAPDVAALCPLARDGDTYRFTLAPFQLVTFRLTPA